MRIVGSTSERKQQDMHSINEVLKKVERVARKVRIRNYGIKEALRIEYKVVLLAKRQHG